MDYHIRNIRLAPEGGKRVAWAAKEMKVLSIASRETGGSFFQGKKIVACLHITSETANLAIALKSCGAKVVLAASNPLSTQDDVAAFLVKEHSIPVFGIKGESSTQYYENLRSAASVLPDIVVDDGADLIALLHNEPTLAVNVRGATEETTTGITRIKNLEKAGKLSFPVIGVNEAMTKHLFDNRYGTGQSTVDGILRGTNILIAGKKVAVCGYGWCGRGVAKNMKGLGAHVIVTEVDEIRALEAVMDGFEVMPLREAAPFADLIVTVTGNAGVVGAGIFLKMKDGAILANAGHFNVEIDTVWLETHAEKKEEIRPLLMEYTMKKGKKIYLLAEGRLVNLACAEGHPSAVMDMSFANQFFCAKLLSEEDRMTPGFYRVPETIDRNIAMLKLRSLGVSIDSLTGRQKQYLRSWNL
ncbi:MAG: adenosylhomocysteinase [Candidatus Ratteibacteria bacterium]